MYTVDGMTEEEYLERINEELDYYEEWWYYDTVKGKGAMVQPVCFKCKKTPEEILEYQPGEFWEEGDFESPSDFVQQEEGTYNPNNGHFACTDCYIKIGMPASSYGWTAP